MLLVLHREARVKLRLRVWDVRACSGLLWDTRNCLITEALPKEIRVPGEQTGTDALPSSIHWLAARAENGAE